MNYVESLNMLGEEAKQIPCITGKGTPNESTEGAVGCLYMNTDNGETYKCIAVKDGAYIWVAENVASTETDEKYFDIDIDGIISLKPEYRGDTTSTLATPYPDSISDKGVGFEGSKIVELPERIVIPQSVYCIPVTGLAKGMFAHNRKIKEVVIPSTVKAISGGAFREAIYLKRVENTEQIETIDNGAFSWTRIEEIRFPNLTTMGSMVFKNCSRLRLVDLGNITTIGNSTFSHCENLEEVLGGANVTSIGTYAFYATRRLKTLPFLANVKTIEGGAFWSSRCDLEDAVYDKYKMYPTYKHYENDCIPSTGTLNKETAFVDYTQGVPFTPCENELNSLFHQKNPLWQDKVINGYDTQGYTYGANGCAFIVLAEIYSAFMEEKFNSPEAFAQILVDRGLTQYDYRNRTGWMNIAKSLFGEENVIDLTGTMTSSNLKTLYDNLSQGALVYKSTVGDILRDVQNGEKPTDGGHAMLAYGINAQGEMLTVDSSMHCYEVEIYEPHKTAWHIYKHGSKECDAVIVKNPKAVT